MNTTTENTSTLGVVKAFVDLDRQIDVLLSEIIRLEVHLTPILDECTKDILTREEPLIHESPLARAITADTIRIRDAADRIGYIINRITIM